MDTLASRRSMLAWSSLTRSPPDSARGPGWTPAEPGWIAQRITLLLAPYSQGTSEQQMKAALLEWVGALRHLPKEAIAAACRDWPTHPKAADGFRPVPAQILQLAIAAMPKRSPAELEAEQEARARLAAPVREVITDERRAEILEEMGFSERRIAAILGGRRMPPPGQMVYDPAEVVTDPYVGLTADEVCRQIAARPYTDEQRRMMGLPVHTPGEPAGETEEVRP